MSPVGVIFIVHRWFSILHHRQIMNKASVSKEFIVGFPLAIISFCLAIVSFQLSIVLHEVWLIADLWPNVTILADKDNLMWLQNGKQVQQFLQRRFSKTAFSFNFLKHVS